MDQAPCVGAFQSRKLVTIAARDLKIAAVGPASSGAEALNQPGRGILVRVFARFGVTSNLAYLLSAVLFLTLVSSGVAIMGNAWRQLLAAEAAHEAASIAATVERRVPGLAALASARVPLGASTSWAIAAGQADSVVVVRILDTSNTELFAYRRPGIEPVVLTAHAGSAVNLRASGLARQQSRAWTYQQGEATTQYATAIMPILDGGLIVGSYEFLIDITERHLALGGVLTQAMVSLGLILCVTFALPGIGFWLRTRQKDLAEQRLKFLAEHDALTSLPNRARLMRHVDALSIKLPTGGRRHAVLVLGLDHFKDINGTHGHAMGDQLLKAVAARLEGAFGNEVFLSRPGGDEFVIIQPDLPADDPGDGIATRLLHLLEAPFAVAGQSLEVAASLGIAMMPDDGGSAETLMHNASLALGAAKAEARGTFRHYEGAMDAQSQRRRQIAKEVRSACESNGFMLNYQPVYSLSTGLMSGFEALVRLPAQGGGFIPPSDFIPVAEELGLIHRIGAFVLETACKDAAAWPHDLTVAVNVSPAEFREGDVVERVSAALARTGLSASRLEIEITEGVLLDDTDLTRRTIEGLKKLGVAVVLDDFGTGFSSLSYLWQFRFDKIKIDQSFVRAIGKSGNVTDIIRTIIALGRSLDLRVTAEGVETEAQANVLKAMRCDLVQGYLYSKPVPLSEVTALVERPLPRSLAASATRESLALRVVR